ncbi:hypothetical protein A3197_18080 [Candidatus Thiodiazotropha endoloripes]|nr:hypothetical protein A3197_18080 [Candidatus Thiodiazotropha endoloripes]
MRDPFSYSARWDSVGLDCAFCKNQKEVEWPNNERNYSCLLFGISLEVTIASNGFKEGEWFCSSFESNGEANAKAINEFNSIKSHLEPNILYGAYGEDGKLKEIPFNEL